MAEPYAESVASRDPRDETPGDDILVVRGPGLTLGDYRNACSGKGPLSYEWADKPHRLVYDLINEVKRLNSLIDGSKRPPELSPEERKKRADQRDRGVLNDGQADG